jgi:hypothetical protein
VELGGNTTVVLLLGGAGLLLLKLRHPPSASGTINAASRTVRIPILSPDAHRVPEFRRGSAEKVPRDDPARSRITHAANTVSVTAYYDAVMVELA